MFTIGLEFSLAYLKAMQRLVFGLGGAQVVLTTLVVLGISLSWGLDWRAGLALGGIIAMSSTAIVSKLLAERVELHSSHGRQTMGVLLFQDLAVVPFLVLIPALAKGGDGMFEALAWAALKAALALALILYFGQKLMSPLFHAIATHQMSELSCPPCCYHLGPGLPHARELSLALGAFAGVLISETEYRYRWKRISNLSDMLLGLFLSPSACSSISACGNQAVWVALLPSGLLAG